MGHVPHLISASCSLCLRKRGSAIHCKITGTRRYSRDLPQGGFEVPCVFKFSGESTAIDKLKILIQEVLIYEMPAVAVSVNDNVPTSEVMPISDDNESCDEDCERSLTSDGRDGTQDSKIRKIDSEVDSIGSMDSTWVIISGIKLKIEDKVILLQEQQLHDNHINFAQALMKAKFSTFAGLASTQVVRNLVLQLPLGSKLCTDIALPWEPLGDCKQYQL